MHLRDFLGLTSRFALAAQSRFRFRVLLTSTLAAVAVSLGFVAVSVVAGFSHVDEVSQRRSWDLEEQRADASAVVRTESIWIAGENMELLSVAPLGGGAVVPPGLQRLPRRGSYAVSPALASKIERSSALDRLMPVDAIIRPEGVASGSELYAIRAVPRRLLLDDDPIFISGFGNGGPLRPYTLTLVPIWAPGLACLVFLVLPAVLLLVTASKLAGAVREHRVLLMSRLGARSTAMFVGMAESILLMAPGLLLATALWLALVGRLGEVPFVGSPLTEGAWAFGWAHGLVLVTATSTIAIATLALMRRRSVTQTGAGEQVGYWRTAVFGVGLLMLLVAPWLSSANRSALFLGGTAVSTAGVCIALPYWFQLVGARMRSWDRPFFLFDAGARLARFPRTQARGWAAMAAACATFTPALVMVNLNAQGDTDLREPPSSAIAQFSARLGTPNLRELSSELADAHVAWVFQRGGSVRLSGTCESARQSLRFRTCRELRSELGSASGVQFVGTRQPPDDRLVVIWGRGRGRTLSALAEASKSVSVYSVSEKTTPYQQRSPLVPWLLTGIAIAVLAALLAILVLVVDRSMTAREQNSMQRFGLSLKLRRLVDASTFAVGCWVASSAGLMLGVVSAIILARDALADLFPWAALLGMVGAVVAVSAIGAAMVAVGSDRAMTTTTRRS